MTPDDFANRMLKAAQGVEDSTRRGLEKGGAHVKAGINAEVSGATHGTYALRGTAGRRKKGAAKMKVVDDFKNTSQGAVLILSGTPKGIWSMLDSGTEKHLVGAGKNASLASKVITRQTVAVRTNKKGKTTEAKRKRLRIGSDWVTGPFYAGGSPARHTFKYGVAKTHDGLVETIHSGTEKAILRALTGR